MLFAIGIFAIENTLGAMLVSNLLRVVPSAEEACVT